MRFLLAALLLAAGLSLSPCRAAAADDPYTVSGIKVDASAPSTVGAQTKAIDAGRDRAWAALYRRLTRQQDWARQPALDPTTLRRLVRSYEAHNVRSSTTRFVAEMTYVFNGSAVRRILQEADIAYSEAAAKPVLVIPLGPAWSAKTPWTRAWADPSFSHGSAPLVLPPDDAIDAPVLAGLRFDGTAWADVEPMASRVHAADAWLVLVIPERVRMIVKFKRLGPGSAAPVPDLVVPVPPRTPPAKAFAKVAEAAANAIVDSWKSRAVVDYGKQSQIVASLHMDSLEDWSRMLEKLESIPTITDTHVVAMDIGEARVEIAYVGTSEQLNDQLAREGLGLAQENGEWWLAGRDAGTGER